MKLSRTHVYWLLHTVGWGVLYSLISLVIYQRPVFVATELLYALVLVASTALGAHLLRLLYKHQLAQARISRQVLGLLLGSVLVAATATLILLAFFFLLTLTDYSFPVPPAQRWFVIKTIFSGNFINMLMAMLLWSACYFAVTKVRQLRQTTALLTATQLDALLNQLNPHFLFNVLNNIRALILEDPNKARDMLSVLADMLRYNLDSQANVKVALRDELEVVHHYLALCAIQFEQRLRYEENIPPDCMTLAVPRLLLQLCVENAIKHGISTLPAGGCIQLTASIVDDKLQLRVLNDGQLTSPATARGVGLTNIRQRLALLYQSNASIKLVQQQQNVLTEICLPMEPLDESGHC